MSKFTEQEILVEALIAIDEYGKLTTTELISVLRERMNPSGHDTDIIKGRNDDYFSQKVRNLKSHKTLEPYAIMVEEGFRKTVWYSKKLSQTSIDLSSAEELKALSKKGEEKKVNTRKFIARFIDYVKLQKERQEIGRKGEDFVMDLINKKIQESGSIDVRVRHVSVKDGDGAGYDISVLDPNGKYYYIEVKTTVGKVTTPFYMSENERIFCELHVDEFILARVYNFDRALKTGEVVFFTGHEILDNFNFVSNAYKVTSK